MNRDEPERRPLDPARDELRPDGPDRRRGPGEPEEERQLLPWEEEPGEEPRQEEPFPDLAARPAAEPEPGSATGLHRHRAGTAEAPGEPRRTGPEAGRSPGGEEEPSSPAPAYATRTADAAGRRWEPPGPAVAATGPAAAEPVAEELPAPPLPAPGGWRDSAEVAAPGEGPVEATPVTPLPAVESPPVESPPVEAPPAEEPEKTPAERLAEVAAAARRRRMAAAAQEEEADSEARRDYRALVRSVDRHVAAGYDLLGLVGYSGSGKTHFLKALSLLLKGQGFEVADWERLRRVRVPTLTAASVFDYPCTGPRGEKWVLVDAGGELYARLRSNDWELADASAGLLHSLYHCRGLFLLLHLQPGHLHRGTLGTHRWMSSEERQRDADAQKAQEELEFFDHVLLFLRALKAEGGDVTRLVIRCAEAGDLDKALRSYRDEAPRLDIPVAVLFTQADTLDGSPWEVAEGEFVSPRQGTVGVMPFVARHLPDLFGSLLRHARRFKFDFVQSYEEKELPADEDGRREALPRWEYGGEPLSVGALAALEFVQSNLPAEGPAEGRRRRLLRRFELETRHALRLDRLLHPGRWRGVGVKL